MPTGRPESRHVGSGRPWRWLLRRPAAAAVLCCGLLAVGGGAGGLVLLTGPLAHHAISPRPVAHPGPPPAGAVVAPPRPLGPARVARPVLMWSAMFSAAPAGSQLSRKLFVMTISGRCRRRRR